MPFLCSVTLCVPLWLKVFENACSAHAAAHAHGDETVVGVTALEFADDGRRQLRASAAERMPERNCPPVRIDLLRIQPRFFDHCERLRGEGFVQLDHVDVRELEPCHLQSFRDCEYRAESHFFRL